MQKLKHILVVLNRSERVGNVMEKAAAIAAADKTPVHVIRVIHEEFVDYGKMSVEDTQALKLFIMQAEEECLVDLMEDYRDRFSELESMTIWNKRTSSAVLDLVAEIGVDLVLKSTDVGASHFPRHPDDWNLVREAQCPILFVGPDPWSQKTLITAACDALNVAHDEINRRILDVADSLAGKLDGVLDVVNVYPRLVSWSTDAIGLDFVQLKKDLEQELQTRVNMLVEGLSSQVESIRTGEGVPAQVIKNLTDESNSDVIVVGTAARKGVSAWVIGNTSEALLDQVTRDLLILHV